MAQHATKGARFHAITANRLDNGEVVYFDAQKNWQSDIARAAVLDGADALDALMIEALSSRFSQTVVDVYAFAVDDPANHDANTPVHPLSVREIIRAAGPTIRLDLGKQADAPRA